MTFTIPIDDYSPMTVGDTGKPFAPGFVQKQPDGTLGPFDLTGLTITMKMQGEDGTVKTCDPTKWTIDDAPNGKAHYQWQAADVNAAGMWNLYIVCTNAGGQPVHADMKLLQIKAAP